MGLTAIPPLSTPISVANGGTGRTTEFPKFKAGKGGTDQTVTEGVMTTVTWPTEIYDVGGYFASNAWVPPAGKVRLTACVEMAINAIGSNHAYIGIYKNGTLLNEYHEYRYYAAGTTLSVQVTTTDDANGTDSYTVKASGKATTWSGLATQTWFCGEVLP